jgi:hypothetical protein
VTSLVNLFVVYSHESQYRAAHRASSGAPSRGSRALLVIRRRHLDLEGSAADGGGQLSVVEVDLEHGKWMPLHTHPILESLWITQPITTATAATKSEVSSNYRNDCRPGTRTPSPQWKAATGTRYTWTSTGVATRRLLRGHRRSLVPDSAEVAHEGLFAPTRTAVDQHGQPIAAMHRIDPIWRHITIRGWSLPIWLRIGIRGWQVLEAS